MKRASRWLLLPFVLTVSLLGYRACAEPTQPREIVRLTTDDGRLGYTLAFSSDGRSLLGLYQGPVEKTPPEQYRDVLRRWEVATWRERSIEVIVPPKDGSPRLGAVSPDGQFVATSYMTSSLTNNDGSAKISGEVIVSKTVGLAAKASFKNDNGFPSALAFSQDSTILAFSWTFLDGGVSLVDLSTCKVRTDLKHKLPFSSAIAFTPDGKALALGGVIRGIQHDHSDDIGKVTFHDLADGKELKSFTVQQGFWSIQQLAFFAKGERLAVLTGNSLKLWEVSTGKEWPLPGLTDQRYTEQNGLAISPNGKFLVVSDHWRGSPRFTQVRIWDLEVKKELYSWKFKNERVTHWCFSPDSKLVAACATPGVVVWKVAD